jgi:hypothetical protein
VNVLCKQFIEIAQKVLETGELPMSLEREMKRLLESNELSEAEMAVIDQLIDGLCKGTIRSVPDRKDTNKQCD